MITVEYNPHYRDDEASLQCGSAVYALLRDDGGAYRAFTEEIASRAGVRRSWRVYGERSDGKRLHVKMLNGTITMGGPANATMFYDYGECKEVAMRLLNILGIVRAVIVETVMLSNSIMEVKRAD